MSTLQSTKSTDRSLVGVVDDDDAIRDSIRILLESHGLDVSEFNSAEIALASPERSQCFCLVVDMEMPETGGLELVEAMRAAADQTPVILMTGKPQSTDRARIRKSKALALLVKPVQQNELLAWIHHVRNSAGGIGNIT